jgi:zinc/manganese transport system substrate-binding protein
VAVVSGAQLVVYNGGGYDDWMQQLVESAGGDRKVINVAELSGLAGGDGFTEHIWYHVPTMQQLAAELAGELSAIDPGHASGYRANADAFSARATAEIQGKAEAIGRAHPGARVAVTEPVPGYLIESAGLVDATPPEFARAIEEDTDPPAAVVAQTLQLFGSDPVRALIVNAQTETPTTDQVRQAAQTGGVPIVEVSETLPAGSGDYVSWMGGQVDALATALDKD